MGIVESSTLDQQYYGFRIYKLFDDGPLKQTGVNELEDFIIPPEDIILNSVPFTDYIKQNLNIPIILRVFNLRNRNFKEITVTPNTSWGDGKHGALGASVRYENYVNAHKNILRVITINENSLAQRMNLISGEDFIIAIRPEAEDISSLNSNSQKDPLTNFKTILRENMGKNVDFFIFNEKTGARIQRVFLENKNGGEILGCDVGYGKIHEFPKMEFNKINTKADNRVSIEESIEKPLNLNKEHNEVNKVNEEKSNEKPLNQNKEHDEANKSILKTESNEISLKENKDNKAHTGHKEIEKNKEKDENVDDVKNENNVIKSKKEEK